MSVDESVKTEAGVDSSKKKNSDEGEISIDFSKIKGFFKKVFKEEKKEEHKEEHKVDHHETKKESDEINIDFGKIKNFFKSVKIEKEKSHEPSKEEDISIDWAPVLKFLKSYGFIILALIPIFLAIHVRMLSDNLPITDRWADDAVGNSIRSNLKSQIDQQFPNLPEAHKQKRLDDLMREFYKQNGQQIGQQIRATSDFFKSHFKDNEGYTYMPDIDPYYWVRYAKNILEKGAPGDEVRGGEQYDIFQLAPIGRPVAPDTYHSYFLAYFHKFLSFFARDITIVRSASYSSVFISAFSVLLAFLIGRKIAGNAGGFFSALMLASNTAFLGRTLFGHADNDAWVVFYPLIATLFFMEAIDSKKYWKSAVFAALAGISVWLFSFAWNGWWYIFDFLLGVAAVTFVYYILLDYISKNKNVGNKFDIFNNPKIRNILIVAIIFFIVSGILITWSHDFKRFQSAFSTFTFSRIKAPVTHSLWPNVLTTVAELNPGSYDKVIESMGGPLLWYISLIGVALALLKKDAEGKPDIKYSALLAFWLAATSYASLLGIRFTVLVAPAFSIAFGTALGMMYMYAGKWLTKELHIHKIIAGSALVILFLILYIDPVRSSMNTAIGDIPIVNDVWYNSLTAIKNNSTENAIITSWWDFGHHFKWIAERPVTFDGTTQTSPASHWVGRFFSTSDENEARGILRMLDCGSNNAYNNLLNITNNTHKSFKITKELVILSKEDAERKLEDYGFNNKNIESVLKFTHCKPPEGYVIASNDMIGKSGVWGHFGAWNFERADIWFNTRKMEREEAIKYMMNRFNYTSQQADDVYSEVQSITSDSDANSWVAPWPGYAGTTGCSKTPDNQTLRCGNGFQINLTSYDIYALSNNGIVHPKTFAYFDDNYNPTIKGYNGSTVGIGATLIKNGEDSHEIVLSSPELTAGMFTRMFYMGGKGLRHFDRVDHQRGVTGTEVYVYKAKIG